MLIAKTVEIDSSARFRVVVVVVVEVVIVDGPTRTSPQSLVTFSSRLQSSPRIALLCGLPEDLHPRVEALIEGFGRS